MTAEEPSRSRADRIGQLAFVVIVCVGLAALLAWLGTVTWPHWWFWLIEVPSAIVWVLLLLVSGLTASLGRRR